jgi:hypothetical protein
MQNNQMPSEGNRSAQTGNESASYDAACCASSFTGGIQSEALCPETPGSQEPDSLGFATSVDIEESPKSLRLQCSCGVIHQLKHIRTRKGARLLLSQPSSQSSRTSQPQVRSFVSEELRSVLFGDRSSNSDFLHNGKHMHHWKRYGKALTGLGFNLRKIVANTAASSGCMMRLVLLDVLFGGYSCVSSTLCKLI